MEIKLYCQMTVSQAASKLRLIRDTMLQMTKNTETKFFSLYYDVFIIQRSGTKHSLEEDHLESLYSCLFIYPFIHSLSFIHCCTRKST